MFMTGLSARPANTAKALLTSATPVPVNSYQRASNACADPSAVEVNDGWHELVSARGAGGSVYRGGLCGWRLCKSVEELNNQGEHDDG
ncbi:hypothetical protein HORIV_34960 [Vreelandella olivaria]|uniref:Uncharacterized protein n=1 Tax=Vreelandella olivaria TaxID=390919 RepID=A0ABN5WXF5_9GAMM|nr:hypothetical protein HORIV_34960 [Halomonas olivaria]